MRTINTLALALALFAVNGYAHDEGHGPKLTDSGKYGGLVRPVVDMKEVKKGTKASLVYKAELVRSSSGKVRVYLYDTEMKPLDLNSIDSDATGILGAKVKGKYKTQNFKLKREENHFIGNAPKAPSKPFNYDFHFKEGSRKLLTAFDRLD